MKPVLLQYSSIQHQVISSNADSNIIGTENDSSTQTISQYNAYDIVVRGHFTPSSQVKPDSGPVKSQPMYTNDGESIVLE